MNYYALVQLINTILFFSAGLFVYLRDKRNSMHKSFFIFCLSVSAWTICYVRWQLSSSYEDGLFWARALHIGAIFIPVTFSQHVLIYLEIAKKRKNRNLIIGGYIFSLFLVSISYTPLFVKNVAQELSFPYWPKPGFFYHFFIIYLLGYAVYSWYLMKKKYSTAPDQQKQQIKYMLAASMIGYLGGGTNFFLHYSIPIPPFGDFLCPLYPIGIAYLILKHKLWGINVIIRKGLIYSMLAGFISSIFFALILVIEKFFQGLLGYQTLLVAIMVGFLLVFGFNPVKNFFQRFVDRRFFRGTLEEVAQENIKLHQELLNQDRMKAVATISASMAHEIKNPLTIIRTFTDFLPEKYKDTNFIDNFIRLVKPQVEKIELIVQQLLDFSKPSLPDLKPVNIYNILNEVLELLTSDFLSHRIRAGVKFPGDDIMISADSNQLKQVFLNLFLNSIDAMPKGGDLIISGELANNNSIEITIQDTGEGISKENLKRIFQPFFTTKPNGTGLGLSVVKDILDQHKANIRVESEEGKTTKFIMKFPAINKTVANA